MDCARCGHEDYVTSHRAYRVNVGTEPTLALVKVCAECVKDLEDWHGKRFYAATLPIYCTDQKCAHWFGTVYYEGDVTVDKLFPADALEPYFWEDSQEADDRITDIENGHMPPDEDPEYERQTDQMVYEQHQEYERMTG